MPKLEAFVRILREDLQPHPAAPSAAPLQHSRLSKATSRSGSGIAAPVQTSSLLERGINLRAAIWFCPDTEYHEGNVSPPFPLSLARV